MKINTLFAGQKAALVLTLCCAPMLSAFAESDDSDAVKGLSVPGIIEAEDLDATDYYFQQTDAVNHSIREDVDVAIKEQNGIVRIGNTTAGDYFTYTFNVLESGRYKMIAHVATGGSRGGYTLTFDKDTENARNFAVEFPMFKVEDSTNPWNDYGYVETERIDLTEGTHKMRLTVDKPLNIDNFEFVREGDIPTGVNPDAIINAVPGEFLGGDIDCTEGSYYFKQFVAEGANLKNEYKANPDVQARIKENGVLGNTSADDFCTYVLNVKQSGVYNVTIVGEAPENGKGSFKMIFAGDQALTGAVIGQGWNVPSSLEVGNVELTAGYQTMRFEILSGINIDSFKFEKTGDLTSVDTISTENAIVEVYSIDGRYIRTAVNNSEILEGLDSGIYIIGGKKVLKK